jgi:hypothetical protein
MLPRHSMLIIAATLRAHSIAQVYLLVGGSVTHPAACLQAQSPCYRAVAALNLRYPTESEYYLQAGLMVNLCVSGWQLHKVQTVTFTSQSSDFFCMIIARANIIVL